MDIPRFEITHLNPQLASGGTGDAFQGLLEELYLPDYPLLHRFPGGGKDGGIDLIQNGETSVVFECKVIGSDDIDVIRQRWRTVKKHLQEHLSNPNGPTVGQSQYRPWFYDAPKIGQYMFCVSATFSNEQQRRDLRDEIRDFFSGLADSFRHLLHLKGLVVEIIDWNDISTRLNQRPQVLFRWFPSLRPSGLVPLEESKDSGTFRAYLLNAKLPYYSLDEHLTNFAASDFEILGEKRLLERFDELETTGLVISGKGGIGKSRLTLELGWLAHKTGWMVFRVQSRLRENALESLAIRLSNKTPALLLIDYIETQNDFVDLVETLNVLNDTGVARLRYVAACRTSFYQRTFAAVGRHVQVDLAPPPKSSSIQWLTDYRKQTVARILTGSGLEASADQLAMCRDIPILAVFLSYLHTSGRREDLAELLSEIEFGRWVAKRVQLTFGGRDVSRELALLIATFPSEEITIERFIVGVLRQIFDSLATDGWIEKVASSGNGRGKTWITAHDVLADQVLLSYLRSIPLTTEGFVSELLQLAGNSGCLESSIISLQRVAEAVELYGINWLRLISKGIEENESSWRDVREILMRTTLLTANEKVILLRDNELLWQGSERDVVFHGLLGRLIRRLVVSESGISQEQGEVLIPWVIKAAKFADKSNFIITEGLRLAPELLREVALIWIANKWAWLPAQYLIVAWLKNGLEIDAISGFVVGWCGKFSRSVHASFVYKAWLDAGGDKAVVEEPIKLWLTDHQREEAAQFVYKPWLDADGDKAVVEEPIKLWLTDHQREEAAQFVYQAWLDAGGDKAVVEEPIKLWLTDHQREEAAQFVYQAWLDAGGDKAVVEEPIKLWLTDHQREEAAQFVYQAWLDAGGDKAVVEEPIKLWLTDHQREEAADYVYKAWLDAGGDKAVVEEPIKLWLTDHQREEAADYVYPAWLNAGGDKAVVEEPIKLWLTNHQREEAAQFVYKAWLDAGGDKAVVEEPIKLWLTNHQREEAAQFVYPAWLNAGGDKAVVEEPIKLWLTDHQREEAARFVYKPWLDAGGDKAVVEEPIKLWLTDHQREEAADYVYKAWLDAGGDKAVVEEPIKLWLTDHQREEAAQFVYQAWLNAGGDKAVVEEPIRLWLTDHQREEAAQFVYKPWLDADGAKAVVEEPIKLWLTDHQREEAAQFVYKAWLDAGGDKAVVEEPIKLWLTDHQREEAASYVYKAWLRAGGSIEVVRGALRSWLSIFGEEIDADYVIRAWLECGGEREWVWDTAVAWLAKHRRIEAAVYLTKYIARQRDLPASTTRHILEWCRNFPQSVDALWRLTQLKSNLLKSEVQSDVVLTAEVVLEKYLLESNFPNNIVRGQIIGLLSLLLSFKDHGLDIERRVNTLFVRWLKHPQSFSSESPANWNVQRFVIIRSVFDLIDAGYLELERDKEAISRFLKWFNTWNVDEKESAWLGTEQWRIIHPAPDLWKIVDLSK